MAKAVVVGAVIVVIIVAAFAFYAGWTYPRTTVNIPVSFTVGVDSETVQFEQPVLDDKVQVVVDVQSGTALWQARIVSGDQVIWEHSAAQGEQQSYSSGWLVLQSGAYNFTFSAAGAPLDATVTVTSKGGFW